MAAVDIMPTYILLLTPKQYAYEIYYNLSHSNLFQYNERK